MNWEDILKINLSMKDIRDLGTLYSIKDMYEGKLVSQEEYDTMTHREKRNYHGKIANYLYYSKKTRGVNIDHLERELNFHQRMGMRLQNKQPLPTFPTYFEGWEKITEQTPKPTPEVPNQQGSVPTLIMDYFRMFRNRGIPTLEDISTGEGRPLTREEIEGYEEYRKRMEE